MADIAAKLGISRIAVSMALRNHHRISVARRREVRRAAQELGYVPDPFLSALAAHRRQRVPAKDHGVLAWINHWKDPRQLRQFKEFDLYWRGASEAAGRFGYRHDEIRWEPDCPPGRLEKILLARGIEGVLIPPHLDVIEWGDFDWSKFSVVRFGLSVPSPDSNVVTSDSFRATVMAVRKMHEYGYRRIGLTVNGEFNRRVGGNLLSGYFFAQKLLGLKPALPPLLTFLKDRTVEELSRQKAALERWLKQHRPDALLISDIEVPGMLRALGHRIPQDIAVAGTTVVDIPGVDAGINQHAEAIGRTAVEMLLKQMNVNAARWATSSAGSKLGHASGGGPIRLQKIVGPAVQTVSNTFRLSLDRVNWANPGRGQSIWVWASHPGDAKYKSMVQQAMIRVPQYTEGAEQKISFPEIADVKAGTNSLKLNATSDAGTKVYYFVAEGPAEVAGDVLQFTKIPPRARFPVKVTVVAWQHSLPGKVREAVPVEREFFIQKEI